MANRVAIDAPAPELSLDDLEGRPFSLAQFRDRRHVVLVLNRGFT